MLFTIDTLKSDETLATWRNNNNHCDSVIHALESGKAVYLPNLPFELENDEKHLLNSTILPEGKRKNISYHSVRQQLKGFEKNDAAYPLLKKMLDRYAQFSTALIHQLFPHYTPNLTIARTSFRPVEVAGRQAPSYRKDDTRLHIDAFPASPNQGRRLLRVFSNINPDNKPRVWRLGDDFENLAQHFKSQLKSSPTFYRRALQYLNITSGFRTEYDQLMLELHNRMKFDMEYQRTAPQQEIELCAGGTWIVYTDKASHAALAGQFCCEQTFILPVAGMKYPDESPLKILEKMFQRNLINE